MKKILFLATAALILSACGNTNPTDDAGKRKQLQELKQQVHALEQQIHALETELADNTEEKLVNVKTTILEDQKFEHFIEVTGTVEAEQDVDVSPESAGVIKEVLVVEGQNVSKGQVMAKLNTDLLERSIDELQVQLDLAVTNYERQKNLWDQNIGSEMQFLQAKNNKESLEKRIQSLNTQIEMSEVKSPINGVVDVVYQKKGHIGSPQVPFAKVINTGSIKIYGDISESYITKVHKGDEVEIRFPALDKTVKATINQIGNTIDPNNRTFRVRINLNNSTNQIKPNLISVISLRDYVNESAIVVPSLYIKEDFKGHYTYISEKADGKDVAKKVYVTPGVTNNNMTEITDGLTAGMHVISEGYNQVINGTAVKIN
ncbi:efflux RND transporter periplasmic adaptor subunit [Draconibacterium sp. IB214405]|uniref:efflux RND transporter periplasmic adaptor subunit n=1 Tax=Draconibacterium sp. IB214405 TaxID=3097352 RepID=UPI002A0EA0D0|nr:efflux RND transporter periplasmic adaptor subunit [Draconibacterium sp. IB214405]MDX8338025.1 efflux RND transporter periplasmic adaptor subunit [Draconibacterium sp. IB214405]